MVRIQDAVALVVLCLQSWIPVFWLLVHPAIGFWRRYPRACYYGLAPVILLATGVGLWWPSDWWLERRFTQHWLAAAFGLAFIATDLWLMRQVERALGWRVLVGLPELMPGSHQAEVKAAGIYERVRHPRYLGMILSWLGAVLLAGSTRLLVLVAVLVAMASMVMELEERELLKRLGAPYADYRRRVPRLLPRLR
ncbi:MAG TPA: methyltransferase [Candidatus Xenobia bacterium]|nr:methyltransferase [Candidatus Xenobia bacterium]